MTSTTSSEVAAAARALIVACRHLAGAGLSPGGSGNVSVRTGDVVAVTPTGSSLSRVVADDLAVVSGDQVVGGRAPSKELPLHRACYAARGDVHAVVHLHSPYAVAASCLPALASPPATGPLPALTPYQVMRLGALPVVPYAPPGSRELADRVAALAAHHDAMLLANHGPVVAASSLSAALDLAEELEAAARLYFLLIGVPHHGLTQDQVDGLRG